MLRDRGCRELDQLHDLANTQSSSPQRQYDSRAVVVGEGFKKLSHPSHARVSQSRQYHYFGEYRNDSRTPRKRSRWVLCSDAAKEAARDFSTPIRGEPHGITIQGGLLPPDDDRRCGR